MTTIGSASSAPAIRLDDDTIRLAATGAIRLAGALTAFAGLILTTQALIAASAMLAVVYGQGTELRDTGVMTAFSELGSALVVVVWGALLTALARPVGRFVVRVRGP